MRKKLVYFALFLLLASLVQAPVGLSEVTKTPIKIDPNTLATMSVADNKLQVSKWAGFSTVSVEMPSIEGFTDYEYRVSDVPEGKEVDLILYKVPQSNVFYYPITNIKNAEFYYQPPLTPEEIVRGCIRPENVVGSYAVYGPKKDNEYGTGKIMHIYRPKVHDAKGVWIWGVLNYKDGVLSVTVDAVWLAKAVYPVTVDPIFGYNSVGGATTGLVQDFAYGNLYTTAAAPATSVGIAVYAYVASTAGTTNFKVCAWAGTDGGALIADSDLAVTSASAVYDWKTANYVSAPTFSASTTYNVGLIPDGNNGRMAYDLAGGTEKEDTANSYAAPGVFNWNNANAFRLSVYIVIGTAPTITSSIITDMDDSDNCYAMKKYYTFQTEITDTDGATDIQAISVRGMQGANVRWLVNATSLDGGPAYAIIMGASTIDLDSGSCSFGEAGNVGTLTLKIRFEWDYTQEENCELAVWASDVGGSTVGWTTIQTDYFDIITRLTTYQFGANNTSPSINKPITLSGFVRYCTDTTGLTSSTSYPPNAQFTSISIYDDEDALQGTNATIINGAFSINITSAAVLRTTAYHAYLNLVPDYTDGNAPDGDLVYVTTVASFYISDTIIDAFNTYGMAFSSVTNIISGLAGFFTSAAANMLSLLIQMITLVSFVYGSVIFWLIRFASFFIYFFTLFGDMLAGGGALATELGDIWAYIGFVTWVDAVPVFVVIYWMYTLEDRSRKSGRGLLDLMISDLQVTLYLLGVVWEWTSTVFNVTLNLLMSFAGLITG